MHQSYKSHGILHFSRALRVIIFGSGGGVKPLHFPGVNFFFLKKSHQIVLICPCFFFVGPMHRSRLNHSCLSFFITCIMAQGFYWHCRRCSSTFLAKSISRPRIVFCSKMTSQEHKCGSPELPGPLSALIGVEYATNHREIKKWGHLIGSFVS